MNKAFSLFLFLLMFSLFITSGIESHPFIAQPSEYPSHWVPVYLNLNESKDITICLWNGLVLERWITINQSGLARFTPNILVILESQYPFTVNGKPAWYDNGTAHPFYFYEFRANESMTLNIDFLPKPLPNTPVGYINLDSPTPVPANETNNCFPSQPVIITHTTNKNSNYLNLIASLIMIIIIVLIIVLGIIKKK